jgi:hypothetical protein
MTSEYHKLKNYNCEKLRTYKYRRKEAQKDRERDEDTVHQVWSIPDYESRYP